MREAMTSTTISRLTVLFTGLLSVGLITACSGGGGSSTPAPVGPPLGGIGASVAFDQRVNFTVMVPPTTVSTAARRRHSRDSNTTTNPYVSPNTASVSLQVVTVNGDSPRTLPTPVTVNVACTSGDGCSVPIQNVPAAKGVNRFSVQTYSGAGGTGNLISTGFIDVTAPSTQATSFGGTALTIGGFVQSISLTLTEPTGGFTWKTASNGTLDVNAIDPAGAIIIGSDQLANAIAVSLPASDDNIFALNGAQQVSLQNPAQSYTLSYSGAVLLSGSIDASTIDQNSQPVATSIPIALHAPPTPVPSPVAVSKPPLSLYVYDGGTDRVFEFAGVNSVEGGQTFSTTPRRIFDIGQPPSLSIATVQCASQGSPFISGMAFTSDGTMYAQTFCNDVATATQFYTFVYPASTQEIVTPSASPTPPPPSSVFAVSATAFGAPYGIKVDEAHQTVLLQYENASFSSANIIGVPIPSFGNPTTNIGATCLQELGFTDPSDACANNSAYNYGGIGNDFAIDGNGNIFLSTLYAPSTDGNGNPIIPPGSASQAVAGEPAVITFPEGLTNAAPAPSGSLAGFNDELGPNVGTPPYVAIEGSTLFTLASPGQTSLPGSNGNSLVWAGLSGCSAVPTANATPDLATSQCTNTNTQASYIAGFTNGPQTITSAANAGTNVLSPPTFMLGGDVVGGFGQPEPYPGEEQFAVRDGFAYVLNSTPYDGSTIAEIDVYNLNAVTGYHTDIPPVTRLVLDPTVFTEPAAIAIGPTGTTTGGAALLRHPARVHRNLKIWAAREMKRLKALRAARHHGSAWGVFTQ